MVNLSVGAGGFNIRSATLIQDGVNDLFPMREDRSVGALPQLGSRLIER